MSSLIEWETRITDYERQSGDDLSDRIKCAVIMKHVPVPIQMALRSSWHDSAGDYAKLRAVLVSYLVSGRSYDSTGTSVGPQPMDVGALSGGKTDKGGKGAWAASPKGGGYGPFPDRLWLERWQER